MYRCNPFHTVGAVCRPPKGVLSEINTADPIMYTKHRMGGQKEVRYHVNIIDLLERVFDKDGMRFLSQEQERFIEMFFIQAGEVYDKLQAGVEDPFEDMDDEYIMLDKFLGNYKGIDEGPYTR